MAKALEKKLKAAGLDTSGARVYCEAVDRLQKAGANPTRTAPGFIDWLCGECPLLAAIFTKQEIGAAAFRYLKARADEMAGKPAGGGQRRGDTQHDYAPAKDGRGQVCADPQERVAPSAAKRNGEGHCGDDTQKSSAPPPRRTPASDAAATRAVEKSIWDRRIGLFEITLGSACRPDWVNLKRKGLSMGHVADRMLTEIDWPDDTTPLPKVATPEQVEAILRSGAAVLDSLGITRRGGASHVR